MIILPRNYVDVELGGKIGVTSRYKLIARKAESGIIVAESAWSKNIVVNNGLDSMVGGQWLGGGQNVFVARVGTGNTPPDASNTDLQARHGTAVSIVQAQSFSFQATNPPFWKKCMATFRFPAGTFNNTNISEVGIFGGSGNNVMYSRALVVDANNVPTTITLAADEVLDVLWDHYIVASPTTGNFNQIIDGVSTPFTFETSPAGLAVGSTCDQNTTSPPFINVDVANVFRSCSNFRNVTALGGANVRNPTGTEYSNEGPNSTAGTSAYVPGTYQRAFQINTPLNFSNNAAGINGMYIHTSGHMSFKVRISPAVLKTATKTYAFNFTVGMGNTALPE